MTPTLSNADKHQAMKIDDESLKAELADVKTELAESQKNSSANSKKYKLLRVDYDTLMASYKSLEADEKKLQTKNEELAANKFNLLDELDDKDVALHHMKRDLNNELEDTKAAFEKLLQDHSILSRKNASTVKKLQAADEQLEVYKPAFENEFENKLKCEKIKFRKKLKQVENERDNAEKQLKKLEEKARKMKAEKVVTADENIKSNNQTVYEIQRCRQVINDQSVKIEEFTKSDRNKKMELELLRQTLNKCPKCVGYRVQITQLDKSNGEYKSKLAANRLQLQLKSIDNKVSQTDIGIIESQKSSQNMELLHSYDDKLKVKENDIQRLHGVIINLKNDVEKEKTESRKLRSDLWKKKKEETEKREQNTINDWYSHQGSEKKLELSEDHANKTLSFLKTDGHEHCTETSGWITLDDSLKNRSSGLKRPRFDK